jgi:RHS repeat-associated protein
MLQPGRRFSAGSGYRYGFNGKENDKDVKGDGNQQDYGMRIYDPRLGRFLSEDPLTNEYPELTPYQFASNCPIDGLDLDGLEFISFKQFKQKTPLVLITQAVIRNIQNKPVALVFKLAFTTELPKKFIDRYASGSGQTYKLNNSELDGLHVTHVGLHGGAPKDTKKAEDFLATIKPGESKQLPEGYRILDYAREAGTLGYFTIKLKGAVTKDKEGNWTFKGEMQFFDVYDFKTQLIKNKNGADNMDRNTFANQQTDFADKYLPGKAFNVTSDWIPIEQNSKKDNTFTWFNGKSEDVILSRVTPVQEAESKKTNSSSSPNPPKAKN